MTLSTQHQDAVVDDIGTGQSGQRIARFLPLTGVVFAVLAMAGNLTIGNFPDEKTSISKLITYYATHHATVGRGGMLLGYSTIFFAFFGVALWARIRRTTSSPVFATTVLVGTAMLATSMLGSADTYLNLGTISTKSNVLPAALQAWHISGAVGGSGADMIVFLLPIAVAGIVARAIPRWLAWSALALAIMHLTPLGFAASLLMLLWAAVAGVVLTVRRA